MKQASLTDAREQRSLLASDRTTLLLPMPSRIATLLLLFVAAMPAARGAAAVLQVAAAVAPRVVAQVQSAPTLVQVDQQDLERGYIDIATPLVIRVRSNLPQPFALEFRSSQDVVSRIEARAISLPVLQPVAGGLLVPATVRDQSFNVRVRLFLGPGAVPGRYPWPVRLGSAG